MLIVFDLDDTLVDTSGCVIYPLLKEALLAMMRVGLVLEDPSGALAELRQFNAVAGSAKEALVQFTEKRRADKRCLEVALETLYPAKLPDLPLEPLEGAVALLGELSPEHLLALATRGRPSIQRWKLEKAGIDSSFFSKILIIEEGSKKPLYEELIEGFECAPADVLVCGDRICPDLTPAKELGCRTVHMRWGRGLSAPLSHPDVDYSIHKPSELRAIIREIIVN